MRIITDKEGIYKYKLEKLGRVKRIFWNKQGRPYYNRGRKRTYLDTIEVLPYPFCEKGEEGNWYLLGHEYMGTFSLVFVEVMGNNESVQLWTEI